MTAIRPQTDRVSSFTLSLPAWRPHRAGQHYDVRLTAEDGYRAQRSYSIASAPEARGEVELGIERIPDGEVSPYFHDVLVEGDRWRCADRLVATSSGSRAWAVRCCWWAAAPGWCR